MSKKRCSEFGPSRYSAVLRDRSKLAFRFPMQLLACGLIVCLGGCAAGWPTNGRYNSYQFESSSSALEYPVALRTFIQQIESEELAKKLELDAPLHVLHAEFPALSREQFGQKVGRVRVVVLFAITANGTVDTVQVESSPDKDLTELALAAVSKWKFRPIAKKGKPTMVRLRIPFIFAHREG